MIEAAVPDHGIKVTANGPAVVDLGFLGPQLGKAFLHDVLRSIFVVEKIVSIVAKPVVEVVKDRSESLGIVFNGRRKIFFMVLWQHRLKFA